MKAIVTVTGKDAVGIIAGVCQELAGLGVNILDINQTVMDGFFCHEYAGGSVHHRKVL